MKRKLFFVQVTILVVALGLLPSCSFAPEDQPWAYFASKVALEINISEDRVFDAFEQVFKEGVDIPSDRLNSRIQTITDEDAEQIAEWYQNRPEGVSLKWFNSIDYFGSEIQFLYSASDDILEGLASKVASILKMSKQDVIDAFNKINRELIDDMHKDGLTHLVEEGYLTQNQVDVYFQWYLSRPDVISPGRITSNCSTNHHDYRDILTATLKLKGISVLCSNLRDVFSMGLGFDKTVQEEGRSLNV